MFRTFADRRKSTTPESNHGAKQSNQEIRAASSQRHIGTPERFQKDKAKITAEGEEKG
jgi:hypothetical protein